MAVLRFGRLQVYSFPVKDRKIFSGSGRRGPVFAFMDTEREAKNLKT